MKDWSGSLTEVLYLGSSMKQALLWLCTAQPQLGKMLIWREQMMTGFPLAVHSYQHMLHVIKYDYSKTFLFDTSISPEMR
jgi:hypothetical protein